MTPVAIAEEIGADAETVRPEATPPNECAADNDAQIIGSLYRKARTSAIESVQYAIECGRALKAKKASLSHGGWLGWLEENADALGFDSPRTAQRLMDLASNTTLTTHLNESKASLVLQQLWGNDQADNVHFSSASAEWYTPDSIVQRVVRVLGHIDLDPCADARKSVTASAHYTKFDDGLSKDWKGRVYMNPPYGNDIPAWVGKLCGEYKAKRTTEAIALVPARVDTNWFSMLRDYPVCFLRGRLKFGGCDNSAPFPSAVTYLGPNVEGFAREFSKVGDIWVCCKVRANATLGDGWSTQVTDLQEFMEPPRTKNVGPGEKTDGTPPASLVPVVSTK